MINRKETFQKEYNAEEYDIVVAGGGIAGIAAAQNGSGKVLLVGKQYAFGGEAAEWFVEAINL